MTPDQSRFLFDFLIPQLKSEQAITYKILSSVPPGMEHYRPAPTSMSAFQLARHITATEIWFLDVIINRSFHPLPDTAKTCHDIAAYYFTSRMPLLDRLSSNHLASRSITSVCATTRRSPT